MPFRTSASAKTYREIWTKEGSPLLVHGKNLTAKIRSQFADEVAIELAMRYQEPSIHNGLESLRAQKVSKILVVPLFPQYASATTGSIHEKVMEIVSGWQVVPEMCFVDHFYEQQGMIEAFAANGKKYDPNSYDHVLFSFHGLPERHIKKADSCNFCLKDSCCDKLQVENQLCYKAQCHATARAVADQCSLAEKKYTICFQSRLGKDPWIEPFTSQVVQKLAKEGKKKVLVFCPAFVADCLETTFEIGKEYREDFIEAGGEQLDLVESLNAGQNWVMALADLIKSKLG